MKIKTKITDLSLSGMYGAMNLYGAIESKNVTAKDMATFDGFNFKNDVYLVSEDELNLQKNVAITEARLGEDLDAYFEELEEELDMAYEVIDAFESREANCVPAINYITYCDKPGKETVVVLFKDGTKVVKKLAEGDTFDLNVGVALCIAEKMFGSKSAFHKMVKRNSRISK